MKKLCFFLALTMLISCRPQSDPVCDKLFLYDARLDDSLPAQPHIPDETRLTPAPVPSEDQKPETATPVSDPVADQQSERPPIQCPGNLEVLPLEIVPNGPFPYWSDFFMAPDGERIAIRTDAGVNILSIVAGEQQPTGLTDFPWFWIAENSLVLSYHDGEQFHFYAIDLETGQKTPYEMRWEYNDVAPQTLAAQYYTGWQASENLEVRQEIICKAVHDGRLSYKETADGSYVLFQEELLRYGGELIRETHPELLSYDDIAHLREAAHSVSSIVAVQMESPVRQAFWYRILVLTGLPNKPHNMLIHTSSQSHWEDYPLTLTQLSIDHGGIAIWTDTNDKFFVARDVCGESPGGAKYRYVLYHRYDDTKEPVAIGIIPYTIEYGTRMDWSPDGRYIYIKQPIDGVWMLSRLALPIP